MAGNPFSAVPKFAFSAFGVVELRIHPVDADGISRADFYDTVRVNDTVDYRTWWPNGLNCASRFKVTSVGATASPRTFGIEHVPSGDLLCGNFVPPGGATGVHFVWRPPAGIPGRRLLYGEPYRAEECCSADEPAGHRPIGSTRNAMGDRRARRHAGDSGWIERLLEPAADAPPDAPRFIIMLLDAATGSKLAIDGERPGDSPHHQVARGGALFDQIMASIRRVE